MSDGDARLFDLPRRRVSAGRVRRGLEVRIKRVRDDGISLEEDTTALARTMADQIDALQRWNDGPDARPYDRVPLTGMAREYADICERLFAPAALPGDPISRALAEFMAAEAGTGAEVGDPSGPLGAD